MKPLHPADWPCVQAAIERLQPGDPPRPYETMSWGVNEAFLRIERERERLKHVLGQ